MARILGVLLVLTVAVAMGACGGGGNSSAPAEQSIPDAAAVILQVGDLPTGWEAAITDTSGPRTTEDVLEQEGLTEEERALIRAERVSSWEATFEKLNGSAGARCTVAINSFTPMS